MAASSRAPTMRSPQSSPVELPVRAGAVVMT